MDWHTNRILGFFNPSVQPQGTLITAEVVHGGGVDINVTWRDEEGHIASRGWCKSSGWDMPKANIVKPSDRRNFEGFGIFVFSYVSCFQNRVIHLCECRSHTDYSHKVYLLHCFHPQPCFNTHSPNPFKASCIKIPLEVTIS